MERQLTGPTADWWDIGGSETDTMNVLLRIACLCILIAPIAGCGEPTNATRILFIGNSFTYGNDLPRMFAELSEAGGHTVVVDFSAMPSWELNQHLTTTATLDKLAERQWHVVVLQERSFFPADPDLREHQMYPAVRRFDTKIRNIGAKTMLFMTWADRSVAGQQDFYAVQSEITHSYMKIGNELNAVIAPVGSAWQTAFRREPSLALWDKDNHHSSVIGSYLAACVFYSAIFRQSPSGVSYTAGLPEKTAQRLQEIAAETTLKNSAQWNIRE